MKSIGTACMLALGELKCLAEWSLLRFLSLLIHHSILAKINNCSGSDTAEWGLVCVSNKEMHRESAAGLYLIISSLLMPLYVLASVS